MVNKIYLFVSSVTSKSQIRTQQSRIQDVFFSCKIEYEAIDVAADKDALAKMRSITQDPHSLPPQIANGDVLCGDYAAFEEAVECKKLKEFLKLED